MEGAASGTHLDDLPGRVGRTGLLDVEPTLATLSGRIRIASWNVREGIPHPDSSSGSRPMALREIVRLVHEHTIDVLALQEVDFTTDGESEILLSLLGQTELQYAATLPLSASSFEPDGRAGVAVVSRYPVSAIDSFYLRNPRLSVSSGQERLTLHDKGAVSCTIDFGLEKLSIVSLHSFPFHRFGHNAHEPAFTSIWHGIGAKLSRHEGRRLVLCGDFNTESRSVLLDSLSFPMTTSFSGLPTHHGKGFDDVLYSPDLTCVNRPKLIHNFSDHRLCLAELALRR